MFTVWWKNLKSQLNSTSVHLSFDWDVKVGYQENSEVPSVVSSKPVVSTEKVWTTWSDILYVIKTVKLTIILSTSDPFPYERRSNMNSFYSMLPISRMHTFTSLPSIIICILIFTLLFSSPSAPHDQRTGNGNLLHASFHFHPIKDSFSPGSRTDENGCGNWKGSSGDIWMEGFSL